MLAGTRTPTSALARFRAGNGEELGWTQHSCNLALLLFANPQPHGVHRGLSQGPSSHYRLEIGTAPAGFTRPVAQPSARCPPVACGGSVLAGTRMPTSVHACIRAANGTERGRTQHTRNPALPFSATGVGAVRAGRPTPRGPQHT